MEIQDSSDQKIFKNTFAPHVRNKELTVHDIIAGLRATVFHFNRLPKEVQDAVEKELERQESQSVEKTDPM